MQFEQCARSLNVRALYHYDGDNWVALLFEAPEFLSRPFRIRVAEAIGPDESFITKRDPALRDIRYLVGSKQPCTSLSVLLVLPT